MTEELPMPGSLCGMMYPTEAFYIDREPTGAMLIMPGSYFVLLDVNLVHEMNVIECTILLNNCKMWFNIHMGGNIIPDVRGVESYDIPFTTVADSEPGLNDEDAS